MNKEELLLKIKTLAEKGVGGEKENAELLLKKLCDKYGITEELISEEQIKCFDISWGTKLEKELAHQVFYSVVGNINENKKMYTYTKRKQKGCIECTYAEFLEFQAKFNFYKHHLKQDLKIFYSAFVQRNSIFPDAKLIKQEKEKFFLSDEDIAILNMAKGMEKHNYNQQIEYGG